uniref:Uncharacterized protein n=1 Tax=Schistocephalus solidus TaxID=70667 RepID=A0A0V0J4N6_SCHSO
MLVFVVRRLCSAHIFCRGSLLSCSSLREVCQFSIDVASCQVTFDVRENTKCVRSEHGHEESRQKFADLIYCVVRACHCRKVSVDTGGEFVSRKGRLREILRRGFHAGDDSSLTSSQ